jgi:hypothetical protein
VAGNLQRDHSLESISLSQRERLAYIDFTLMFKGEAGRQYITDRFKVAPSVATRDFALYHDFAPQNIKYDDKLRQHIKTSDFKPLFDYDVIRTLATFSQGFGDGLTGHIQAPKSCEAPYHLNSPDLNVVATISEAIHKSLPVEMDYVSPSSGTSTRVIVPHTIIDTGLRWHVRAFDRHRGEFRDFVLTRIKSINLVSSLVEENEYIECDIQWNNTLILELIVHPRVKYPEAVELDYGMQRGSKKISIRAALAGYMLRLWSVDCSKDHHKFSPEFQLALNNQHVLSDVDNALLAPGGKSK